MIVSSRAASAALIALGLAGCAGAQRAPDGPLVEATPREQLQAMARIRWEELFERGNELAATGDYTRAEQYIAASIARGGPVDRVLPRLLRVCITGQRYRAAVEYARPYLDTHASAWALRYLVASIYVGLGEPLTARRHLELVVQYNPRHADAEFLLGKILKDDLSDPADADTHFRRYLELEPQGNHADEARSGLLVHVQAQAQTPAAGQAPSQAEPQPQATTETTTETATRTPVQPQAHTHAPRPQARTQARVRP